MTSCALATTLYLSARDWQRFSGRSALPETMVLGVQPGVVDVAPQLEIGEVGGSAVGPVPAMVGCAQLGRRRAARAQAVAIAQVQRLPHLPGHRARAVADMEDLARVVHQRPLPRLCRVLPRLRGGECD